MQDTYTDKVRVETLVQGLKSMQESINKASFSVWGGRPRDPTSCHPCRRRGWTLLLSMLSKSSRRQVERKTLATSAPLALPQPVLTRTERRKLVVRQRTSSTLCRQCSLAL